MKTALFTNFSSKAFTGYWNGKGRTFEPGKSEYMPDYLARHFAKHLANRELIAMGKERDTSPKVKVRPDGTEFVDNQAFLEVFNKAYTPDTVEDSMAAEDPIDVQIKVANQNREKRLGGANQAPTTEAAPAATTEAQGESPAPKDGQQVQVAQFPPDGDDDESSFEGKPQQ